MFRKISFVPPVPCTILEDTPDMVSQRTKDGWNSTADVWKYIATGAISMLVATVLFMIRDFTSPKNATLEQLRYEVQQLRGELPGMVHENNPYTADQKAIAEHLASIDVTLIHIQDRQQQQATDIANIATATKVTAHPIGH